MTNFEYIKGMFTLDYFRQGDCDGSICDLIRKEGGVCEYSCDNCYKWLAEEHRQEILTAEEKAYLSALIRPFRDSVRDVEKIKVDDETDRICIGIYGTHNDIFLPPFDRGTMYRGMEYNVYTLEELGL